MTHQLYTAALLVLVVALQPAHASEDEERLMNELFKKYNYLILPVRNFSTLPMTVQMALQLQLLIDVVSRPRRFIIVSQNEMSQVMQTNVWVTLKWHDFQMVWNPIEYGQIETIRVPPDKIWVPDIVLFNNADGQFEVSYMCNVVVSHDGSILWVPPAIYKSSCIIDVENFPFDIQNCFMKFGSWTYSIGEMQMDFAHIHGIDLSEYSFSSVWDVIDAPAFLNEGKTKIDFFLQLRRKTLFYTVVLIIPTVLMAFLSMAVFFLPADSTEKMTFASAVLLSIVVFLLLVCKILPPTSKTIPLMAKYLLLTFVLNVITILITVVILNIFFRGPNTHRMPFWVRRFFLQILPKFICMSPPRSLKKFPLESHVAKVATTLMGIGQLSLSTAAHHPFCPSSSPYRSRLLSQDAEITRDPETAAFYPLTPEAVRAIDAIESITEHLKAQEEEKVQKNDWRFVGQVIDRLLLYVFFGITLGGTLGILLSADDLFKVVDPATVQKKYTPPK